MIGKLFWIDIIFIDFLPNTIFSLSSQNFNVVYLNDHVFLHADKPLDDQELARVAIQSNHLLRTRGTQITEEFEDDFEGLEAIRELGQQVVSGDQYLEEAWAEILKDCTEFEDLDGKVCIRK